MIYFIIKLLKLKYLIIEDIYNLIIIIIDKLIKYIIIVLFKEAYIID